MYVKCAALEKTEQVCDLKSLGELLKKGNLLTSKGEARQEIRVYMGGAFFKGLTGGEEEVFPWVFSTFDLDRDDERIDPMGWDLKNYQKNPVILWAHDSRIPAIGFSKETQVRDRVLGGNIVFNPKEMDPFGWGIGQRVAARVIRAGSVGFLIQKIEITEESGEPSLIFRNQELLEFSICNIPSNPQALNRDFPPPEYLQTLPEETHNSFWKGIIKQSGGQNR
ncbi:peptidase [Oceanispirochaeta sp.]|jgi:HK97 family phage prohead protease|uniref:peptidase n=1 Tax=Oceanispirochaeta sp. TaxID=2035350 RepID=UPI002635CD8A|nr:peptidase [Oceanispirochaeta sp.]MDA3957460.1 peptidase [Oceanispirochaeta sp.]